MVKQERSNEELCILAQQGDEGACLQLLKQNRAYIVLQMTKLGFRYHPYLLEIIVWGEVGFLGCLLDYDPSLGNTFLTFATNQILTELRNFLHSIRMAYMENDYPDDEDGEGDWAGEELCFLACQELRPLEKMYLSERRDLLLYASMDSLPELERRYIDYRYGFATGKHMPRSAVAKILGVPEAEAKRIEADALEYLRGCFHVDNVNAFYELRPEADTQKALAQESFEALIDSLDGNYIDSLLAQFEEDD